MEAEYQLFTIETADRAGAITAVAASFASRGVNIECFLATELGGEFGRRRGKFVVIVEADRDYAIVLKKGLKCLDVVHEVSAPRALELADVERWRSAFAQLSRDFRTAAADPGLFPHS
jgi:uncharacterized protein with ACT and thioredoxin-like domain